MICLNDTDTLEGGASIDAVVDYTVHGLVGTTFTNIAQGKLSSTDPTILYTAGAAISIVSIIFVNTHSAAVTVNLYLDPANAGTPRRLISKNLSLDVGHSMHFDGARITVMNASGQILGTAAAAAHGPTHQKDGSDEISVAGLSGLLADDQHVLDAEVLALISGKNFIINGEVIINQRVTAYTLVKDTYGICADRFYGMATGTAVSAGTLTATTTANCGVSGNAFKFSGVTLTGTGIIYFRYRMEAKDAVRFKNQTASFRCQVYQDTGGAINYTVYVRKANAANDFSAVTNISNSGAISVPNATATSLPYLAIAMGDCSNGIEIEIKVECGAITTKNFEFTECQFELGSVATPFEHRPYAQELAMCQRYYSKSYMNGVAPGSVTLVNVFISRIQTVWELVTLNFEFPQTMRTVPTVVFYNPQDGTAGQGSEYADGNTFTANRSVALLSGAILKNTTGDHRTGVQSGDGTFTTGKMLAWHWVASAEL